MTLSSEADFLRLIDKHFPNPDSGKQDSSLDTVLLGRGDDCAVLRFGELACLSSDIFLEDVHFRRNYFSPEDIGHKALAVNISDIAAMGCKPSAFALDLMIPEGLDETYWERLFTGMARLANDHDLTLAGGDLCRAPILGLTVHIWGTPESSESSGTSEKTAGRILTRGNAKPGDLLAIVGKPGLARIGLQQLEKHGLDAAAQYPAATAQHLRPQPRVAEGLELAKISGIRGLMDISDGLARDLPRFLALSEVQGAKVELSSDMIHAEIQQHAQNTGQSATEIAMLGGEDYGLLTAISPDAIQETQAAIPDLQVIGTVKQKPGIIVNGKPFEVPGFDHFGG